MTSCSARGHLAVARLLSGADAGAMGVAARQGHVDLVKFFLDKGVVEDFKTYHNI